jgi:hypothetical protein
MPAWLTARQAELFESFVVGGWLTGTERAVFFLRFGVKTVKI